MEIIKPTNNKNLSPEQAKHANPVYLNYYLFGGTNFQKTFKLIDKKRIDTAVGKLELAIIAESHYIMLKDTFTELLSCADNTGLKCIPIKECSTQALEFSYDFGTFLYRTKMTSNTFPSKAAFMAEEQKIAEQNNLLFHFFEKNTALTALSLQQNTAQTCIIETRHSYPDFNTLVFSTTELSLLR